MMNLLKELPKGYQSGSALIDDGDLYRYLAVYFVSVVFFFIPFYTYWFLFDRFLKGEW